MAEIIVRYFHILGIMVLMAALVTEHLLLAPTLDRRQLGKIAVIDAIYGAAAAIVLLAGLTLWFGVGKPAVYYNSNWIFHLKLTLFVLIAVLSIYPTLFFRRAGKSAAEQVSIPKSVFMVIRLQMLLLVILPLLAILMARGYGAIA